jgi:5-methylthioribose kinase
MTSLDIESPDELTEWLRRNERILPTEQPEISLLSGGVSNRTVLVCRENGDRWVLKQALDKLRVAVDWFSSPLRIHREALGIRWLAELAPAGTVPALLFEDHQQHLLAMQAVPAPCDNWKSRLLQGDVDYELVQQFGTILGTIHRNSWMRRAELSDQFEDTQFFESLRIEPYYSYTATQVPESQPFYEQLIHETRASRLTVAHGDYSPKNILLHRGRLFLIDHEVIHFGDPAFDLGFSLTHLLSKSHLLKPLRTQYADAAQRYWLAYCSALGDVPWSSSLQVRAVQHTLGCLLARVRGRSPLEYLNAEQRTLQAKCVLQLIRDIPDTIHDLISSWILQLNSAEHGH